MSNGMTGDIAATLPPRHLPRSFAPNIIAVASGKGGVGKTWLSITLSHVLARSGRRVLLFDGDIGLANVDVQLGIHTPKNLDTVLAGRARLPEIITPYEAGQFDVIAGRSGSGRLAGLTSIQLEKLRQGLLGLSRQYDRIILDLGAGVENSVRDLAQIAASCLVVIIDEPTSLTDAYAFIKLAHRESPTQDYQIVVNQAVSRRDGERTYHALAKACQSFLGITPGLTGIIRRDNRVKDCIRAQSSLLAKYPGSIAAADVAALSVKLLTQSHEPIR